MAALLGEGRSNNTLAVALFGVLTLLAVGGLAYWVYINTKPLHLSHLGSGKMLMDGSEQVLFEFVCTEPFRLDGHVNLKNMESGDTVVLREYMKLGVDKEYGLYDSEEYSGAQPKPIVYVKPKPAIYGCKITLQQTAGIMRSYEWEFYKGVV